MEAEEIEKKLMKLESLEKRVRELEDIEEIKKLQVLYVNSLTTTDWGSVVSCFSRDAIVDLHSGYVQGTEKISSLFKEKISQMHVGLEGNFAVHPIIKIEGDKARGSWLMYIQFCRPREFVDFRSDLGGESPDWMQGFYETEYVRENGYWKISRLKWRRRLINPLPLDERK